MISYSLKCKNDHRFDSWFQSAEAFDKLKTANMVTCAVCGCSDIEKSIMAPRVSTTKGQSDHGPLSAPASSAEQAFAELRKKIEETSENVGTNFASEARAIHDGDAPARAIYGEAKVEDAKSLIEDGIPVAPLPFMKKSKTN